MSTSQAHLFDELLPSASPQEVMSKLKETLVWIVDKSVEVPPDEVIEQVLKSISTVGPDFTGYQGVWEAALEWDKCFRFKHRQEDWYPQIWRGIVMNSEEGKEIGKQLWTIYS